MRSSIALALAAGAAAAPLEARATTPNDGQVLNYALTLEHLENVFYSQAVAKFTEEDFKKAGVEPTFYWNLKEIAADEKEHVDFLTTALKGAGVTPTAECTYDFGYTDVAGFMATANILEGVGVSAYLGAAQFIANKNYLTAAGSILTIEARHSAYLRAAQIPKARSPFPAPFDTPLSLSEVYSLAAGFIKSCPSTNPALPVKAFPSLAIAGNPPIPVRGGQNIEFKAAQPITGNVYAQFISVTGPVAATICAHNGADFTITIPDGAPAGQSYMVLTNTPDAPTDDNTVAGPAIVAIQSKYTYGWP